MHGVCGEAEREVERERKKSHAATSRSTVRRSAKAAIGTERSANCRSAYGYALVERETPTPSFSPRGAAFRSVRLESSQVLVHPVQFTSVATYTLAVVAAAWFSRVGRVVEA